MGKKLTQKGIEAIKPDPAKRLEIADASHPGLYLVVQPSGAKGWALRYRQAGKPAKLTLGKFPVMGLAEARKAASEALAKVEAGGDPITEKKQAKAAKLDAQLTERDKIKTLAGDFYKRHLAKLKSGDQARQFLERFTVKAWGERDIQTITKRDVLDLLDSIADSGREVTANRVLAHTRKFLNWCVERDVIAISPATGVKPVAKEASRDRVLTDDEIRLFWRACDAAGQPWGPFGKLLLLTGQRLNEVAQMTDAEIRGQVWHLAASRTKNGRAHNVPLSKAASAVLDAMQRVKNDAGYIHCTNGESAVQGFHKARAAIANKMAELAAEDAGEAVEIPAWTFHDLRRTCATGLARLGVPVRVTEAVLNHISGTGAGIVAVYQLHDYADEKRDALEAWGRYVLALVEGQPDNVVHLVEARA